jgi:acetyl esterase/lipase
VNHLVTGNLKLWAKIAKVNSVRLPGYWLLKNGTSVKPGTPPLPGEKVILNLHGGAYIRMSAHPSDPTANVPKGYIQHVDAIQRVFSLEYRLASSAPAVEQYPFPTQLLDALAGYNYLVQTVGFAPEDIIISGDSAGANLALALVRYLRDNASATDVQLPPGPGGLILLSPWADLGTSSDNLHSTLNFTSSDYIRNDGGIHYAKKSFCGPHGLGMADTNEYISPASLNSAMKIDFKGFPRTFLVNGGAEVLYDCIVNLKNRIVQDLGEDLEYYVAPDGIHDYICFPLHEPERTDTLKAINKWVSAKSS